MSDTRTRATNGNIELAFERLGPGTGEPLLLIMGYGVQRHFWPDGLCDELISQGFDVVRYDNRDVGESTHLTASPAPPMRSIMMTPRLVASYRLSDMAADGVAVMDALGWRSAHVMGVSMGGSIAQTLAIEYPQRVRSLVSISSTPSPSIGRPKLSIYRIWLYPPGRTVDEVAERLIRQFRIIGSPAYPIDEQWLRSYAETSFARGHGHDRSGTQRQLAAVLASGSRMRQLRRVKAPTLVVHGAEDPLIRPIAGYATAAAVPGARLVMHNGMGHDLPQALWPTIAGDVARVAQRAA